MKFSKIKQVRAFVAMGGGADYHDHAGYHWIDDHIATSHGALPGVPAKPPQRSAPTCSARWWSRSKRKTARSALPSRRAASLRRSSWRNTWRGFWRDAIPRRSNESGIRCTSPLSSTAAKGLVVNAISGRGSGTVGPAREIARGAGVSDCWAARFATNCSSTPPARVRMWRRRWVSSAASCRCITGRPRARRG